MSCPIGNKGCPCLPVFMRQMHCYKNIFKRRRELEAERIWKQVHSDLIQTLTEKGLY